MGRVPERGAAGQVADALRAQQALHPSADGTGNPIEQLETLEAVHGTGQHFTRRQPSFHLHGFWPGRRLSVPTDPGRTLAKPRLTRSVTMSKKAAFTADR